MRDALQDRDATRFVGADFLTWLWFESERLDGQHPWEEGRSLELWPDDHIVLSADHSDARENALRKGSPATCAEAGAALAVGKKVSRIKWRMELDEETYVFTLDSDSLDVRGLRLPAPRTASGPERVLERMGAIEDVLAVVDSLFARFVRLRVGRSWEREVLPTMQAWVRKKDGRED